MGRRESEEGKNQEELEVKDLEKWEQKHKVNSLSKRFWLEPVSRLLRVQSDK